MIRIAPWWCGCKIVVDTLQAGLPSSSTFPCFLGSKISEQFPVCLTLVYSSGLACMHAKLLQFCLFVTTWNVACQAPLSMGFSWQKYWSEWPSPPPGDPPDPQMEPESFMSPALAAMFFTTSSTWEAHNWGLISINSLPLEVTEWPSLGQCDSTGSSGDSESFLPDRRGRAHESTPLPSPRCPSLNTFVRIWCLEPRGTFGNHDEKTSPAERLMQYLNCMELLTHSWNSHR